MRIAHLALAMAAVTLALMPGSAAAAVEGKYIKTPTGFLMVLRPGDDVTAHLVELAEREKVPGASVSGIGFLEEVKFAYFDTATRQYLDKSFRDVELTGLTGSLSWKDGSPSTHLHAQVSGRDYLVYGGHVMDARVGKGTLELYITVFDTRIERGIDPEIGANALRLNAPPAP